MDLNCLETNINSYFFLDFDVQNLIEFFFLNEPFP